MNRIRSVVFNPYPELENLNYLLTNEELKLNFNLSLETDPERFLEVIEEAKVELIILNLKDRNFDNHCQELLNKITQKKKYYLIVVGQSKHRDFFLKHLRYERVSFIKDPASLDEFIFTLNKADFVLGRIDHFLESLSTLLYEQDLSSDLLLEKISNFLIKSRTELKMTQFELANYLGISLRQFQRIEKADSNMTLENFVIILKGLAYLKYSNKSH